MWEGLKKLFTGSASELIKSSTGLIDEIITNKEERELLKIKLLEATNQHQEKMLEITTSAEKAYLEDVQSARKSNVEIQTSEKVPLFIKLVPYILDCFILLIWGSMTIYIIAVMLNIIKKDPTVNFEGVLGIYAALTGVAGVVINFHRGTSKSSESKQEMLYKIMK